MRKQIAAAAMAASIVTGAGAGALLFGPTSATAATATSSAAAAATPKAPGQWVSDAMKKLVDAGTLTQAQSDAVVAALEAARPADGPGGHGPDGRIGLDAAATAIGITPAQLRTELTAGKTLAQVASAHGVSEQTLIDALVADVEQHLAADVTAGRLTQAQADARKAEIPAKVKTMVESTRPVRGDHGPRDGAPDDASATS